MDNYNGCICLFQSYIGRSNDKRRRRYFRVDAGVMGGESYVFDTFFSIERQEYIRSDNSKSVILKQTKMTLNTIGNNITISIEIIHTNTQIIQI